MTFEQYLNRFKFELRHYSVITEDGYILTLHRVMARHYNSTTKSGNFKPILLMHDLEGSSFDFFTNWHEESVGMLLIEQGYDVWLGNSRGNYYSQGHKFLQKQHLAGSNLYWDFSIEKMGLYDLPAFINFILNQTALPKLEAYIGLGLGNTQFWIASSLKPDYFDEKVHLFVSLAPQVLAGDDIGIVGGLWGFISNLPLTFSQITGLYDFY